MRSEPKIQKESLEESARIYQEVQLVQFPETSANRDELRLQSENWKDPTIPKLQRRVVDAELENLHRGVISPVYSSLVETLTHIPLSEFTLLDAACASGYYSEVIRTLDKRRIRYIGSDYSPAMIESAKKYYPHQQFVVQNLTT